MAVTKDDFTKIWASTSPLTPYSFSESQYKEGWNFIGGTPPSRQMWDFLQKNNDEKMQYLLNHFDNYLPLSGGTLTGVVNGVTPPNGDNSKKLATTEFVNAKAGNYLPLSGGTLTGAINTANNTWNKLGNDAFFGDHDVKGKMCIKSAFAWNAGIAFFDQSDKNVGEIEVNDAFNFNKPVNTANNTWNKIGDDASFGDHNVGGKMCIKSQTARNAGIAFFNQSDKNVGEVDVDNSFNFNKPVKENGGFLVPTGVVQAFAGSTIPAGWLLCDGSAVSRTDYAALFAVIGTTYGKGNGSSTFNLPNLTDKFIQGSATAGTVKSAGLPNITGSFITELANPSASATGAFDLRAEGPYDRNAAANGDKGWGTVYIDASRSSSIYGNSTTVQPPALTMRYIIKY